jgi:hypothetical protein
LHNWEADPGGAALGKSILVLSVGLSGRSLGVVSAASLSVGWEELGHLRAGFRHLVLLLRPTSLLLFLDVLGRLLLLHQIGLAGMF